MMPCEITEDVIRQALKYDKAFDIALCRCLPKNNNKQTFKNYQEWYEYLASISNDVIIECDKQEHWYATNQKSELQSGM